MLLFKCLVPGPNGYISIGMILWRRWRNSGFHVRSDFSTSFVLTQTKWSYDRRTATLSVHYTTSCNTQSSAPEDVQNNFPKHVELTGIINKPLLLHLVDCLYYLYQWCTVKQISDSEIYLLIKYIKSVLWRVAKRLSYIEDARCLKVNKVEVWIFDKWDPVTTAWRVLRLRMDERPPVWRVCCEYIE